jgi:hypothetical protein
VSTRNRGATLPRAIDLVLRELVNALGKAGMYPPGHRFIAESSAALVERLRDAMTERDSITISILPRGLLFDGATVEPLPNMLREFAIRMHRKNIGTIHIRRGITATEVGVMTGALAASDADETIGREGLRLDNVRIEPMTYDVLSFTEVLEDTELNDVFWMALVEAAFGRRLSEGDALPTVIQVAEAISERVAESDAGARRIYEALAAFSSALVARGEHGTGSARRRFVDVMSALSRPTSTRVVSAAPSSASRRRFLRETLELVPPALLIQLLESVAEADGEPISPHLRWMLGKLAGQGEGEVTVSGAFANEVVGLIQQWDGINEDVDEDADARLGLEPARVLALGLELELGSDRVIDAARRLTGRGQLMEVLQLVDSPQNDPRTTRVILDAVLDPDLLERLLSQPNLDFALLERVAHNIGSPAAGPLLDALSAADERLTRRRLLDILVRVGAEGEETLVARLTDSPWYLARNILAVLGHLPTVRNLEPVFEALSSDDLRVRQEALKVLLRQPAARDRAIAEALDSGEGSLARMGLTALGSECPPRLAGAVLAVLGLPDADLQLQAIRALSETTNPLVVPHLLNLVRAQRGFLRRTRLLPKSPVMLAALEVLARRWAMHRPVLTAMQLAAKSGDADIRAALGGGR